MDDAHVRADGGHRDCARRGGRRWRRADPRGGHVRGDDGDDDAHDVRWRRAAMMYWNGHMTTGGWIISILWTAIVIALVIALIVWISSALSRPGSNAPTEGSAREILDQRLVR